MKDHGCGCKWVPPSIHGPGYHDPCDDHAAHLCSTCGNMVEEVCNDDGECEKCANKRPTLNGGESGNWWEMHG